MEKVKSETKQDSIAFTVHNTFTTSTNLFATLITNTKRQATVAKTRISHNPDQFATLASVTSVCLLVCFFLQNQQFSHVLTSTLRSNYEVLCVYGVWSLSVVLTLFSPPFLPLVFISLFPYAHLLPFFPCCFSLP